MHPKFSAPFFSLGGLKGLVSGVFFFFAAEIWEFEIQSLMQGFQNTILQIYFYGFDPNTFFWLSFTQFPTIP